MAPDALEPDTLRAVIESFVLREGTDDGVHETSLEAKVAQGYSFDAARRISRLIQPPSRSTSW